MMEYGSIFLDHCQSIFKEEQKLEGFPVQSRNVYLSTSNLEKSRAGIELTVSCRLRLEVSSPSCRAIGPGRRWLQHHCPTSLPSQLL